MPDNAVEPTFPIALTDGLTVLGNYYLNLYLVQGKGAAALVEMGVSAVADTVIAQLEQLGVDPDYLVVTHPHFDHISGLAALSERYPGAAVIAGQGACDFITHPKAHAFLTAEDRFMSEQLKRRGIITGRPPAKQMVLPQEHIVVARETAFDLGGLTLKCLPVKGHCPGSIVIHIPELDALLLSDTLGFHYPGRGFCPLFFTGLAAFLAALDDMAALAPTIVGPGHQGPITGEAAQSAIEDARRAAVEIAGRIKADPREPRKIARDLFDEFYKEEFTLYSESNIQDCMSLLVRRVLEADIQAQ